MQQGDIEAIEGFLGRRASGDAKGWKTDLGAYRAVGGNMQIVGSPTQVVERFVQLKQAGCDGVQLTFFASRQGPGILWVRGPAANATSQSAHLASFQPLAPVPNDGFHAQCDTNRAFPAMIPISSRLNITGILRSFRARTKVALRLPDRASRRRRSVRNKPSMVGGHTVFV